MTNIAALQMPTLGVNPATLEVYIQSAVDKEATLVMLGDYVLNHFFKTLETMPINMIRDQSEHHIHLLKDMAEKYRVVIVAPIIRFKGSQCYKTVAKVTAKSISYYQNQILMSYRHWNESGFFANEKKPLEEPMAFRHEGIRFGVIGSYEVHFDWFFEALRQKDIDVLLLPSASTFGSQRRWREILKSRAFLNNIYILRVNRIGEYNGEGLTWKFYGDSMLLNPLGEVESELDDKESMMVASVDRKTVREAKRLWGFDRELKERGMV